MLVLRELRHHLVDVVTAALPGHLAAVVASHGAAHSTDSFTSRRTTSNVLHGLARHRKDTPWGIVSEWVDGCPPVLEGRSTHVPSGDLQGVQEGHVGRLRAAQERGPSWRAEERALLLHGR